MSEEDAAVDHGGVAELREARPERRGAVAVEDQPERRADRPLIVGPGPEAALFDQGPGPRRGRPLEPAEPGGGRPARDDELAGPIPAGGRDAGQRRPDGFGGDPGAAELGGRFRAP